MITVYNLTVAAYFISHYGAATHKKRLLRAKPRNSGLRILLCRRALHQGITENLEERKKSSGLKIERGGEKKCKSEGEEEDSGAGWGDSVVHPKKCPAL